MDTYYLIYSTSLTALTLQVWSGTSIYDNNIKTSDLYNNLGDTTYISCIDAVKTSYLHFKTTKLYITINAARDIVYLNTDKSSNQHIMITRLYITNGDTNIVHYQSVIQNEHFRAIDDTVETSNVNIKKGKPGIAI